MKDLRLAMRRRREALAPAEIGSAATIVCRKLWRLPQLARCRTIAGYVAVGGELDCARLLSEARARGRDTLLPVVHGRELRFARTGEATATLANRFGIPEPAVAACDLLSAMDLDVVLAPLVAFDERGYRLGMGGGFYDRTLRFLRLRGRWRRPFLVGLAYEFQRVDRLPTHRWDVPLHAVITEHRVRCF